MDISHRVINQQLYQNSKYFVLYIAEHTQKTKEVNVHATYCNEHPAYYTKFLTGYAMIMTPKMCLLVKNDFKRIALYNTLPRGYWIESTEPNEGHRFRSSAWFMMFKKKNKQTNTKTKKKTKQTNKQKTVASLSSPRSLALHCISVLCTLPFLHHPLTFPSYVGPPSIKPLLTSQSASGSSHILPSMWQLSHLDLSLPSAIFPSFSCSNPS